MQQQNSRSLAYFDQTLISSTILLEGKGSELSSESEASGFELVNAKPWKRHKYNLDPERSCVAGGLEWHYSARALHAGLVVVHASILR